MAQVVFGAGDVVRLKSGGPAMTVEGNAAAAPIPAGSGFAADRMVRCVWHDEAGVLHEHVFWPHLLAGMDGEQSGPQRTAPNALSPRAGDASQPGARSYPYEPVTPVVADQEQQAVAQADARRRANAKEWPRLFYHSDKAPNGRMIHSEEESKSLGDGWTDVAPSR